MTVSCSHLLYVMSYCILTNMSGNTASPLRLHFFICQIGMLTIMLTQVWLLWGLTKVRCAPVTEGIKFCQAFFSLQTACLQDGMILNWMNQVNLHILWVGVAKSPFIVKTPCSIPGISSVGLWVVSMLSESNFQRTTMLVLQWSPMN